MRRPLEALGRSSLKTQHGKANAIKEKLVTLAVTKLPNTFGRKYTEVVLSCLTCLDKGNDNFGDSKEFEDDDGILVGVRYIEKILTLLDDISV
ncbi:hypothetical protein OEA41_004014 [Lepraria neglecta]|uniref:Uncharacterized protein n=1 Tax=Lepraria neglecta TaxID=209136 RepID=A0AAD9Z5S3_9LECA|nr:hypothetical protein OEA41_004014 [Lepraria neglecta]